MQIMFTMFFRYFNKILILVNLGIKLTLGNATAFVEAIDMKSCQQY